MFKLAIEPHILRNHKYDRFSTYYFLSSTTASHRLNLQGTHQLFKIVKPARNRASAFLTWTQKFHTSHQKYLSSAVLAGLFGNDQYLKRSGCEDLDRTSKGITQVYVSATSTAISSMSRAKLKKLRRNAKRVIRMVMRAVQIMLNLAPLLIIHPLQKLLGTNDEVDVPCRGEHDKVSTADVFMKWYLRMCLRNIESCGATVVKIMQWASTRPDLCGSYFCEIFSKLQDDTTPHDWKHTSEILNRAYGEDWKSKIKLEKLIGSGCIGQVYKGNIKDGNNCDEQVAIKVLHPNIKDNIDTDLDILRFVTCLVEILPFGIGEKMHWLNLSGCVEEFAKLLIPQLDLRIEARNLNRFNKNFADDKDVIFPKIINGYDAHSDCLIETFCDGTPILKFAKEHKGDKELMRRLCTLGISTVCRMIFMHNFIHGDLHPGNILISPKDHKFVLLDVGMVTEYNESEHDRLVSILSSFVRSDGRLAGKLMINDCHERVKAGKQTENFIDESGYIDKVEYITSAANTGDYFMAELGTYVAYFLDAASMHHVSLNPTFVSASLAIKIQEGIVLALDPSIEIWRIANPIILQSEFQRAVIKLQKSMINLVSDFI